MRLTYFCIWVNASASLTCMFSNEGENTSRRTPTMRLSSSKISDGTCAVRALATVSSQHLRRVCISWLSSATDFPSAEVRMITPKFFGRMLSTRWRRRSFSAVVLIFWEMEILVENGIRTRYRPVNEISVVRRGPFDEIGSLTICTISSRPHVSWSVTVPCLSMSGSSFIFWTWGMGALGSSRSCLRNSE